MFTAQQLQEFKEKIDGAKTIALFGHMNVDGDAIGSLLGLGGVLEKLGKKVKYYTTIAPTTSYVFLDDIKKIQTDFDYSTYDALIFLDFTPYDRISGFTRDHEAYFDAAYKIIIDHHIHDAKVGNLELKDIQASSNCELIFEICRKVRPELIDEKIATYLYLGVVTDTGNFLFEKDAQRVFANASGLIEYGANKQWITENIFSNNPRSLVPFLQLVMPRVTFNKHVCYIRYSMEEANQFGMDKDQIDGALSFIKSIHGVTVFATFRIRGKTLGCSLRSGMIPQRISVQQIATSLGGGGHQFAAAYKQPLEDDPLAQIQQLVDIINKGIEEQKVDRGTA